jgi:predicted NUDIX family NTP pyrophosphohydrolase
MAATLRTPSGCPEIDRAAWLAIADARRKILKGQAVFVDRLLERSGR